ncbi:methyltransferase family protein [Pseudovibrio exalbescens]|uniref:Isoprenylcysteine carboxyl methyltransferase (ICMT) family protein n=1 Tax=Pseudovibrio exalbescens TaxID=197461 RepID=A0A1U7JI92_9HYPH|nr:isoprenylcysteine carboxylmethyltransferase family protein [Pseudovibrio exalbescens]OKL44449.1 hypothetical protein A3843_08660 [Pseudovibrio exalbescens]
MKFLELKVPPVVVGGICFALMWALAISIPGYPLPQSVALLGLILCVMSGSALGIAGLLEFRRAQTTFHPHHPEDARQLVTSGVYQYTRNPMYMGLLLMLLGWAIFLSSMASFTGLIVFVAYMNQFQITPEERALKAKFGSDYDDYARRVRRWV